MMVLAAMLSRTEGFRARNCRNLIISGRGEDFEEGMTLYERFLRSAEKRFSEEEFLIDTHAQIQKLIAKNEQLKQEKQQLEIKYRIMENKYAQINIGTQNNNCTQIGTQIIKNYYGQPTSTAQPQPETAEEVKENIDSIIFTKKAKKEGKEAAIIEALKNSTQDRRDKTRAFVDELHSWQNDGYVDAHYNAKVMYDELEKITSLTFGYETFKKYYNNTI